VVGEADAKFVVDGPLQRGVGAGEDGDDVFEAGDEGSYVGLSERVLGGLVAELTFEGPSLLVDLGDPVSDDGCVGPLLEDFAVAGQLGFAVFEATP
jgi:hypothetical protein